MVVTDIKISQKIKNKGYSCTEESLKKYGKINHLTDKT